MNIKYALLSKELKSTLLRTIIYTLGHIIIATICNVLITGASPDLATIDALIEPIINGFWYFLLDKIWFKYFYKVDK